MSAPQFALREDVNRFPVIYEGVRIYKHFPILPHWHDHVELLYFVAGAGEVVVNGETIEVCAGQCVILGGNQIHSLRCLTPELTFHCLLVQAAFCQAHGIDIGHSMAEVREGYDPIDDHFAGVQIHFTEQSGTPQGVLLTEVPVLLKKICGTGRCVRSLPHRESAETAVRQTILYVRAHFREKGTVDDICRGVGYSKYHLCRSFKRVCGMTLMDYINQKRCCYAGRLMVEENYTVHEAATQAGFNSHSYFSKVYKKYMGRSPSKI